MNREADYAILDENGNVIPCRNVLQWAHQFDESRRIIEQTQLDNGLWVSTVFLGINHSFFGGLPLWFETMVFGPPTEEQVFDKPMLVRPEAGYQQRYTTLEEARAGHALAVEWAANQGEVTEWQ